MLIEVVITFTLATGLVFAILPLSLEEIMSFATKKFITTSPK
jgi:hypothetical protein